MKNIFESYFTTKDKFQGTGLGLHMSFRIITESLKGTIYMENGKKDFYINLPLLNFS
ncbi:ATP-binding protein [Aliarcobacter butzleri]|uniref:ATP-binding protein n=1 Tax=Aliarcobacter butzleri TaxID=28197 RepID=UPI002B248F97|nr:ATP-binding protein [Aliarcobacter butzleri]